MQTVRFDAAHDVRVSVETRSLERSAANSGHLRRTNLEEENKHDDEQDKLGHGESLRNQERANRWVSSTAQHAWMAYSGKKLTEASG